MEMDVGLMGGSKLSMRIGISRRSKGGKGGNLKTNAYAKPWIPAGAGKEIGAIMVEEVYLSVNLRRGRQRKIYPCLHKPTHTAP